MLTKLLADDIYTTKTMMLDEMILDADLTPRPGLVDLVMEAFTAGVVVGVVAGGQRSWVEPLVRQLVGDGVVETVVTADDVKKPMPDPEAFRTALWELGIPAENALAVTGSASGLRAATSTGLATASSPATAPPTSRPRLRFGRTTPAASRCGSRIANGCTAAGVRRTSLQPTPA